MIRKPLGEKKTTTWIFVKSVKCYCLSSFVSRKTSQYLNFGAKNECWNMQSAFSFHPYMGDPLPMYVTISDTIFLGWGKCHLKVSIYFLDSLRPFWDTVHYGKQVCFFWTYIAIDSSRVIRSGLLQQTIRNGQHESTSTFIGS